MARYDGGWGRFPGGPRYDHPFRPYGSQAGGRQPGRGGGGYDAGGGGQGFRGPWEEADRGGQGGGEEFWDPGTVYGPARYGLGPYHERLRRQRRSDDELKQEVEEALFYDTWVDADAITVEVRDGIVTLRGELPDFDEIRYATDDAWDVDGVRGVRSDLSVRQGAGRSPQPSGAGGQAPGGGGGPARVETAAGSGGGGAQPSGAGAARGGAATKRTAKKSSGT